MGKVRSVFFNIYIALNMLLCSILFAGFSKPRETVSGFIGRKALLGNTVALYVARAIDFCYPREAAHCGETAIAEDNMRHELYPDDTSL